MTIQTALLGLLQGEPSTGYDLKKIFEDSSYLYWSGNNNQIYRALLDLQKEGLVTSRAIHQDGAPSKKVYTVTQKGLATLKKWLLSEPQPPECKKLFLVQLAFTDLLDDGELDELIIQYQQAVQVQLRMERERQERDRQNKNGERKALIRDMIHQNILSGYKAEIEWTRTLRQALIENRAQRERKGMNYSISKANGKTYIELNAANVPLKSEADALDLIVLCGENDTNLLMIHHEALDPDFFDLKTQSAGFMLQKFANYHVKTTVVLPDCHEQNIRFQEMALEANKGNQFRIYDNREQAMQWLVR